MNRAIAEARRGVLAGQMPYGAAIVRNGRVIACEHNSVAATADATAHAEVCAIRAACRKLKRKDLSDCEIFATCEPCAMCTGACFASGITRIYYGVSIEDKFAFGLPDLGIGMSKISALAPRRFKVTKNFCRDACVGLFDLYLQMRDSM